MEHLTAEHREALAASIRVTCEYVLDVATDADIFAIQAALSQHASQVAYRLAQMGDGMLPPSDMPLGPVHLQNAGMAERSRY